MTKHGNNTVAKDKARKLLKDLKDVQERESTADKERNLLQEENKQLKANIQALESKVEEAEETTARMAITVTVTVKVVEKENFGLREKSQILKRNHEAAGNGDVGMADDVTEQVTEKVVHKDLSGITAKSLGDSGQSQSNWILDRCSAGVVSNDDMLLAKRKNQLGMLFAFAARYLLDCHVFVPLHQLSSA